MGVQLPALASALTTFYTNSSAITQVLAGFNTTVQTLRTYPNLLMWCVRGACLPRLVAWTRQR